MERETFIEIRLKHAFKGSEGFFEMEVDLALFQGEILAISGHSGSGKTSLIRMLAGLLQPKEGFLAISNEIWVDTAKNIHVAPQGRSIGMVFQDYALFPHMTIMENLLFGLKKGGDKNWPKELLGQMQLWELRNQKPNQLSGGQRQRVAIIRALVQKPKLLLLDEPLSALDESLRRQIQQDILLLQKQLHLTTCWISHSLIELSSVADRVLMLTQGKIESLGPPEEVLANSTQDIWEGEILKILGKGEYWLRVGNNPYRLFLDGDLQVGDKIYLEPRILSEHT